MQAVQAVNFKPTSVICIPMLFKLPVYMLLTGKNCICILYLLILPTTGWHLHWMFYESQINPRSVFCYATRHDLLLRKQPCMVHTFLPHDSEFNIVLMGLPSFLLSFFFFFLMYHSLHCTCLALAKMLHAVRKNTGIRIDVAYLFPSAHRWWLFYMAWGMYAHSQ